MSTHAAPLPLVRDQFLIGYAPQHEWSWLIAAAFFFGKVGAGLFVIWRERQLGLQRAREAEGPPQAA